MLAVVRARVGDRGVRARRPETRRRRVVRGRPVRDTRRHGAGCGSSIRVAVAQGRYAARRCSARPGPYASPVLRSDLRTVPLDTSPAEQWDRESSAGRSTTAIHDLLHRLKRSRGADGRAIRRPRARQAADRRRESSASARRARRPGRTWPALARDTARVAARTAPRPLVGRCLSGGRWPRRIHAPCGGARSRGGHSGERGGDGGQAAAPCRPACGGGAERDEHAAGTTWPQRSERTAAAQALVDAGMWAMPAAHSRSARRRHASTARQDLGTLAIRTAARSTIAIRALVAAPSRSGAAEAPLVPVGPGEQQVTGGRAARRKGVAHRRLAHEQPSRTSSPIVVPPAATAAASSARAARRSTAGRGARPNRAPGHSSPRASSEVDFRSDGAESGHAEGGQVPWPTTEVRSSGASPGIRNDAKVSVLTRMKGLEELTTVNTHDPRVAAPEAVCGRRPASCGSSLWQTRPLEAVIGVRVLPRSWVRTRPARPVAGRGAQYATSPSAAPRGCPARRRAVVEHEERPARGSSTGGARSDRGAAPSSRAGTSDLTSCVDVDVRSRLVEHEDARVGDQRGAKAIRWRWRQRSARPRSPTSCRSRARAR